MIISRRSFGGSANDETFSGISDKGECSNWKNMNGILKRKAGSLSNRFKNYVCENYWSNFEKDLDRARVKFYAGIVIIRDVQW